MRDVRMVLCGVGIMCAVAIGACSQPPPPPMPAVTAENCQPENMKKVDPSISATFRVDCTAKGFYKNPGY